MSRQLAIGVLSGTSMDGLDIALISQEEDHLEIINASTKPWPDKVRQSLHHAMLSNALTVQELGSLDTRVGHAMASAVLDFLEEENINPDSITVIGMHGQTLAHGGRAEAPWSLQVGDPAIMAAATGIRVAANFRQTDMAMGGQGAPLAPALHKRVFYQPGNNIAVLNLGGIANLTLLHADGQVQGFDTGPGNCLMDEWASIVTGEKYDRNGAFASQGKLIESLLKQWLAHPYFSMLGPKSTGREEFNLNQPAFRNLQNWQAEDIQRTLLALTVTSIALSLVQHDFTADELYVCGGGVHNRLLMRSLAQTMPDTSIHSSEEKGLDPDYAEALLFAWLGLCRLQNKEVDYRGITGATRTYIPGFLI